MTSKIAITVADTSNLEAPMDPRFGRAPAFVFLDASTGSLLGSVVNDAATAAHGAGTGAASSMSRHDVTAVISGHFGPKAMEALEAMKIEMWKAPPGLSAAEAYERFRTVGLEEAKLKEFR